ncbi:MAG: NUDIX hydrolase [Bryobacteraceae bacterium]
MKPGTYHGVAIENRCLVFENSKSYVFSDHIVDGSALDVPDYLVVVPRASRPNLISGVTVILIQEGRVVLRKVHRHAVSAALLEATRGFVDEDEEPPAAALRELPEDTGLTCSSQNLRSLGFCAPTQESLRARIALFVALDCSLAGDPDENELGLGELVSISLEDAERVVREMSLEESTTCIAMHRFLLMAQSDAGMRGEAAWASADI